MHKIECTFFQFFSNSCFQKLLLSLGFLLRSGAVNNSPLFLLVLLVITLLYSCILSLRAETKTNRKAMITSDRSMI